METTLERCLSNFNAPGANEMETEELLPFESVTLPPIKMEQEDVENAIEEPEEEDYCPSNYMSAPISPVREESEVPDVSEKEGELEPSSFLSVSMAPIKVEPEEQQEEDEDEEEIEPSHFLTVSMSSLKEEGDEQTKEDEEDEEEELEPLASVTVSPPIEDVPSKNVRHPSGKWSVRVEGQQETGGGKRVVSSGVWVPGVGDALPSPDSPNPQPSKPPPEDRRSSAALKPFSCEVCAKSYAVRALHPSRAPRRCRSTWLLTKPSAGTRAMCAARPSSSAGNLTSTCARTRRSGHIAARFATSHTSKNQTVYLTRNIIFQLLHMEHLTLLIWYNLRA